MKIIIRGDFGQGLVEYGLILALVSVVAISSLNGLGDKVTSTFNMVTNPNNTMSIYSTEDIDKLVHDEGYIPIASADELNTIREGKEQIFGEGTKWQERYVSDLGKPYILVSDIDLRGIRNFEPIGNDMSQFSGTFDGGGHVIRNLTINRGSENHVGFFGNVRNASIKNVGLENADVTGGERVGGLVGTQMRSSVENSYVSGKVAGDDRVGVLVGRQEFSSVVNSYSKGFVSANMSRVGGLVGRQRDSSILNSHSSVDVIGSGSNVGGLVGNNGNQSIIKNSYATGRVTGGSVVGGLAGLHYNAKIIDSYSTGRVEGHSSTGGLVGVKTETSTVDRSYFDKVASGQTTSAGGFGHSTEAMQQQSTYSGWDFDRLWVINDGEYPTFQK